MPTSLLTTVSCMPRVILNMLRASPGMTICPLSLAVTFPQMVSLRELAAGYDSLDLFDFDQAV